MFAVLAVSTFYIAVLATMKLTHPKSNLGLYILMALAFTFPLNITIGMPLNLAVIKML